MPLTVFPIETSEPKIEVTLKEGEHTLVLEVEDSAGVKSAPAQVTVNVQRVKITGISKTMGEPGSSLDLTIEGTFLDVDNENAVSFTGDGITATVDLANSTSSAVYVNMEIAATASPGDRSYTVSTKYGDVQCPDSAKFNVTSLVSTIESISPKGGRIGDEPFTVQVLGENIADATSLSFKGGGILAENLTALQDSSGFSALVTIEEDATVGSYGFTVITPRGSVDSQFGLTFEVREELVPIIASIAPNQIVIDRLSPFVIRGGNLKESSVEFETSALKVSSVSSNANSISLNIIAHPEIALEKYGFVVKNALGRADSRSSDVLLEVLPPEIDAIAPNFAYAGTEKNEIAITGSGLTSTKEVAFRETGIKVTDLEVVPEGRRGSYVKIQIDIDKEAGEGARLFDIYTAQGKFTAPASAAFNVRRKPESKPTITGIDPTQFHIGESTPVVIRGSNLQKTSSVAFDTNDIVVNKFNADDSSISLNVTAQADIVPGKYGFTVTTPGGTVDNPASITPEVMLPSIKSITPTSAVAGAEKLDMSIIGSGLAAVKIVQFSGTGIKIDSIAVNPADQGKRVSFEITIDEGAAAGARTFALRTPQGRIAAPADVTFTVKKLDAPKLAITDIEPSSGASGARTVVAIYGVGLETATSVEFSGTRIEVTKIAQLPKESRKQGIGAVIAIGKSLSSTKHSFKVTTPGGSVASPKDVVFIAEGASGGDILKKTSLEKKETTAKKSSAKAAPKTTQKSETASKKVTKKSPTKAAPKAAKKQTKKRK